MRDDEHYTQGKIAHAAVPVDSIDVELGNGEVVETKAC
jgi:hypothetical protein